MLEETANEIEQLACNPLGAVILLSAPSSEMTRRELAGVMRREARTILRWADSPWVRLSQLFSFRKVWKHLPLALTVEFVKEHRASRIPWGDLAYALEAIATGYGVERGISPDALRKQYTTFIRSGSNKALTSGLKNVLLSIPFSGFTDHDPPGADTKEQ